MRKWDSKINTWNTGYTNHKVKEGIISEERSLYYESLVRPVEPTKKI